MSFQTRGAIQHRNRNLFLADTGIVTDPFWAGVILLLNGSGINTTDSSSLNLPMAVTNGTITLGMAQPLFGGPTYHVNDTGIDALGFVPNDIALTSHVPLTGEWCVEFFFYWPVAGALSLIQIGSATQYSFIFQANGVVTASCTSLNGGSYSVGSAVGAVTAGAWHHMALCRDNTTGAVLGQVNLALDGQIVAVNGGFPKNAVTDHTLAGPNRIIECVLGVSAYVGQLRFSTGTARYYGNAGAVYTVPTAPFPTQ